MSRFDYEEYYLKFKGKIFAIAENKRNAKVIGETLIQLSDENEQLKEERDYFERKKCDYQKKISILTTDKIQLKQENEQLKSEIEKLSKFENNGEHIRLSINIETGE